MKKSARRILTLALTLVLICTFAVSAFAVSSDPSESRVYPYGNVKMIQEISGNDDRATSWIKFVTLDGTPSEDITYFDFDGRISYTYGLEGCRPNERTAAGIDRSGRAYTSYVSRSTSNLSGGNIMYTASMRFSVTFNTANATVYHNNPATITVEIN